MENDRKVESKIAIAVIILFAIPIIYFMSCFIIDAVRTTPSTHQGYYLYNEKLYYMYNNSHWYKYNTEWVEVSKNDDIVLTIKANYSKYFLSKTKSGNNKIVSDWESSKFYDKNQQIVNDNIIKYDPYSRKYDD